MMRKQRLDCRLVTAPPRNMNATYTVRSGIMTLCPK